MQSGFPEWMSEFRVAFRKSWMEFWVLSGIQENPEWSLEFWVALRKFWVALSEIWLPLWNNHSETPTQECPLRNDFEQNLRRPETQEVFGISCSKLVCNMFATIHKGSFNFISIGANYWYLESWWRAIEKRTSDLDRTRFWRTRSSFFNLRIQLDTILSKTEFTTQNPSTQEKPLRESHSEKIHSGNATQDMPLRGARK